MSDARQLAKVNGFQPLIAVIRARKAELGMSDQDLEDLAGLSRGSVSRILSPGGGRGLGPLTTGKLLRWLGIYLIVAEDAAQTAKIKTLFVRRIEARVNKKARVHSVGVQIEVTRKFLRKIGVQGGSNSRKYVTRRQARALAKHAANARWAKVRAREAAAITKAEAVRTRLQPINVSAAPAPMPPQAPSPVPCASLCPSPNGS